AEGFVGDGGDGSDLDEIAQDRFGVRESILGRVRRREGTAEVVSRPGWGTEVRLRMPVERQGNGDKKTEKNGRSRAATPPTVPATVEGATRRRPPRRRRAARRAPCRSRCPWCSWTTITCSARACGPRSTTA